MLRLITHENFNGSIVRGLLRHCPNLDIVRVQDIGLSGEDDMTILQWAAKQQRVLLTHDLKTIPKHAYERVKSGQPMPGIFAVGTSVARSQVIEDLLLLVQCSLEDEWEGQVRYLPL